MKTLILLAILSLVSCTKEVVVEDYIIATLYYRLEMVDLDSTISYSKIVATKTSMVQSRVPDNDDDDDDPKNFCQRYPNSIKCKTLPVVLEYFRIDKVGPNYVTLKWKSLHESNFKVYNVQRSRDARTYKNIGQVKPASSEYTYTDKLNK